MNNKNRKVKVDQNRDHANLTFLSDEDTKWLAWMEIQFKKIAGSKGLIELEDFKSALGVKKVYCFLKKSRPNNNLGEQNQKIKLPLILEADL